MSNVWQWRKDSQKATSSHAKKGLSINYYHPDLRIQTNEIENPIGVLRLRSRSHHVYITEFRYYTRYEYRYDYLTISSLITLYVYAIPGATKLP